MLFYLNLGDQIIKRDQAIPFYFEQLLYIYLSFFVQEKELGYKIFKMLETAFDKSPIVLKSEANNRYIFIASETFENFKIR